MKQWTICKVLYENKLFWTFLKSGCQVLEKLIKVKIIIWLNVEIQCDKWYCEMKYVNQL